MQRAVLIPAVAIILAAFTGILFSSRRPLLVFFDNVHWTTAYVAAAVLAWIGVRSASPENVAARRWFAWGLSSYAFGQLLWDVQVAIGWNPFPGPSDLFFLPLGSCCALGLWASLRAHAGRSQLRTVALDTIALSVAVLAVTLALYLPRRGNTGEWTLAVMVAYPLGLLTAACIGLILVPTLRLRASRGWTVFLAGLLVNGWLWMRWNSLTLDDALQDGTLYNATFSLTALTMGTGAMLWRVTRTSNPEWERYCEGLLRMLPLLVVMCAAIAVVFACTLNDVPRVVQVSIGAGAVIVAALAMARQSVLLTERDRLLAAEKIARESELNFKTLFETAQDAIIILSADGCVNCNRSALAMYGVERSRMLGRSPAEFSPEFQPDGQRSSAKITALTVAALGGLPQLFEWRNFRADGTEFDAEVRLNRVAREGGFLLQAVIRDITERKLAEKATVESLALLRATLESTTDGILTIGPERKIICYNETFVRIWGMPEEILNAEDDEQALHYALGQLRSPEDFLAKVRHLYKHPMQESCDTLDFKDGRIIERYSRPMLTDGRPTGRVWSFRDITQRKRAEAALQLSDFSVNHASLPTFWFARDARIVRANRAACEHLGYTEAELLQLSVTDLDPDFPAERWPAHWQELRGLGRMSFESRHRRKDGGIVPVEVDLNWFEFDGQEYNFAFARDITERTLQERLVLRSQRMESIGTLAGGIAHDLNNTLAPIVMSGELLRMEYPGASPLLDTIEVSAKRAADMVKQLLTFAKGAEGARVALQPGRLIREMEHLMLGSFPKNIQLRVQCDPKLPAVQGDATQLHQVLLNLCVNARDAMPRGGTLTLEALRVEMDAAQAASIPDARPGGYLALRVSDTGTGIPPEILDRIFDPFFTTKDPDKGTGLGLSTVMGIVKGHGGFLHAQSQPEQGAAFTVYLPVAPADAEPEPAPQATGKFRGSGETILFVDDESGVRNGARAVLQHLNFKPLVASDGAEGLMLAAQHRTEIRAIITDLHMPRMDGLTFVRDIRRLLTDIPIIVASGRMEPDETAAIKSLGVLGRLDKPFTQAQLVEALRALLAPE